MSRQSRRSTLAILFLLSEESKAALCLSSQVENSLVTPYHVLTNDYKGSKTWQQQQRRGHPNLSTTTTDRPPSSIPRQGSSQASKFSFLNVFWIVLTLSIFRMRGIFSIVKKSSPTLCCCSNWELKNNQSGKMDDDAAVSVRTTK